MERVTVMITVKASPEIGRTHGETVCVAGVWLDGGAPRWIRLFPVQWQWFWRDAHPKYQVVEVDVVKHERDQRPESHRPVLETATVVRATSTSAERRAVLDQLPQLTMCDLVAAKGWSRPSLGLVVPREIVGFDWVDHRADASHVAKMQRAAQGSLFGAGAPKLEFSPFAFRLEYICLAEGCRGHRQTIVDWEISEAWRRWRDSYPGDYLERIRDKWLGLVAESRQPGLFVGNQQQAPQGFLVLGIARDVRRREPSRLERAVEGAPPRSNGDSSEDPLQSTTGRLFDL